MCTCRSSLSNRFLYLKRRSNEMMSELLPLWATVKAAQGKTKASDSKQINISAELKQLWPEAVSAAASAAASGALYYQIIKRRKSTHLACTITTTDDQHMIARVHACTAHVWTCNLTRASTHAVADCFVCYSRSSWCRHAT